MVNVACVWRESEKDDPDQRIAAEVIKGNTDAYGQLMERHWARIFSRVYALLNNREDAEEVTQDAFTRAFESLPHFRWEASFSTWLYRIASNLARNRYWYWKRRGRERSLSLEAPLNEDGLQLYDLLSSGETNPADRLRWNEFHASIEGHLDRLPKPHREIMEMRLLDNLSYEEIGESLSIPLGTVKSRIARARRCLSRSLGLQPEDSVHAHAMA